ncbi:MAG: hypothetical protein ACFWT7_00195 [Succiniclasticum sp.]|jgi:putative glutamine amidotransferase
MKKPLIGVTCYVEEKLECEKHFTTSPLFISYPQYDTCVAGVGGIPVNIPVLGQRNAQEYAEQLDGLIVCGGEDVSPEYYHEKETGNYRHVPQRDCFELALVDTFYKRRKPILGICRGMQLINIYLHGTLIQDIGSESGSYLNHARPDLATTFVHQVHIFGARQKILGEVCSVNSMHHQAVKTLGKGLRLVAKSEDGIIEAADLPGYPYLFLVQWHPEMMWPRQKAIFEEFVGAVELSCKEQVKLYSDSYVQVPGEYHE